MSNTNDKTKQKPKITGLKTPIGKSGYKTYMEKFLSKVEENKSYFEKIQAHSIQKDFKLNKNQIVLRQITPVVLWVDIAATKESEVSDIKLDFVDPEHIPAVNLTKQNFDISKAIFEEEKEEEVGDPKQKSKDEEEAILKFFDQQKKNISVDKQKIDRIKEKLRQQKASNKEKEQKGFLAGVLETFKSDFFWQIIALTMLLAVFLFYFQGLQPAILRTYSRQTQTQLDNLALSFNNQLESFYEIQTLATSRFTYDPSLLCSETELYQTVSQDIDEINLLKINLLPNPSLTRLETVGPFHESQIYQIYQNNYQKYDEYSRNLEEKSDEFLILLQFLNYRNSWIQSCQNLQEDNFSEQSRIEACQEITTSTEVFMDQPNWNSLDSEIRNRIQDGVDLCITEPENLGSQWFNRYDLIMEYEPNFSEINEEILTTQESFNRELTVSKAEIRAVVSKKTELTGIFYILDF